MTYLLLGDIFWLGVITLVNLCMYLRTINYGLVLDDTRRFYAPIKAKNKWEKFVGCLHSSRQYICNTKIEHSINLVIHSIVCGLIYWVLGRNNVSLFTALLFAVNPTNTQISVWLNGKRYGVNAIIVLVIYSLLPVGLILYPLTLNWQVSAVMTPLLALYKGYWQFLLVLPLLGFMFFKVKVMGHKTTMYEIFKLRLKPVKNTELSRPSPKKLILVIKSIRFYLLHSLFPIKLSFYYTFMDDFGLSDRDVNEGYKLNYEFWQGLGILATIVTLIVLNFSNPIGLGLFWWLIYIAQWCGFPFNISQPVADRYCYLPNIGLMYALAYLILLSPITTILFTLFLTYYSVQLIRYVSTYQDLERMFRNVLYEFPNQTRARQNVVKLNMTNWGKDIFSRHNAFVECAEGLKHRFFDHTLNCYMFHILKQFGYMEQAREALDRAEKNLIPGFEKDMKSKIKEWRNNLPKEKK